MDGFICEMPEDENLLGWEQFGTAGYLARGASLTYVLLTHGDPASLYVMPVSAALRPINPQRAALFLEFQIGDGHFPVCRAATVAEHVEALMHRAARGRRSPAGGSPGHQCGTDHGAVRLWLQ
jgi:hypothetical protein